MGYFSNGTEGMMYEEKYCSNCIHGQDEENGCAVFNAHLIYNYKDCNDDNSILHILIPRDKQHNNLKCAMFIERADADIQGQIKLF